jgi:hypothetical protein
MKRQGYAAFGAVLARMVLAYATIAVVSVLKT